MPWWPDARAGQPVVEIRGRAIAEVVADRRMDRRQDLQQDEDGPTSVERHGERLTALDGGDEHAHRDREQRREEAVQHNDGPPGESKRAVRRRQSREERPLLASAQLLEQVHHHFPVPLRRLWPGDGWLSGARHQRDETTEL